MTQDLLKEIELRAAQVHGTASELEKQIADLKKLERAFRGDAEQQTDKHDCIMDTALDAVKQIKNACECIAPPG